MLDALVLFVVRAAYFVAIGLSDWVDERRLRRRRIGKKKWTAGELVQLKAEGAKAYQRSHAPTVAMPPPSEREKPGGGGSRY